MLTCCRIAITLSTRFLQRTENIPTWVWTLEEFKKNSLTIRGTSALELPTDKGQRKVGHDPVGICNKYGMCTLNYAHSRTSAGSLLCIIL